VQEINGTAIGITPPVVVDNYSLQFPPSPFTCQPGTGGGVAFWGPFRLDHNTVWNDAALPVEDNLWLFSWRLRSQSLEVDPSCDTFLDGSVAPDFDMLYQPWYIIYSFPTADNPAANMAVAIRHRDSGDEIGVFIGENPTVWQKRSSPPPLHPTTGATPTPVAAWLLPGRVSDPSRLARNYIIALPQPDRTLYPLLQISFRSSPGDFASSATYSDIAAWLDGVVDNVVRNVGRTAAATTPDIVPSISRVAFSYPDSGIVGPYSATYELRDNYDDSYVRETIGEIISFLKTDLAFPESADVLNSGQDREHEIYVIHFTSIRVTSRLPGDIPLGATSLWVDGVEVPPAPASVEPGFDLESYFPRTFLGNFDYETLFPFFSLTPPSCLRSQETSEPPDLR